MTGRPPADESIDRELTLFLLGRAIDSAHLVDVGSAFIHGLTLTQNQVARCAGVSRSTVARALRAGGGLENLTLLTAMRWALTRPKGNP